MSTELEFTRWLQRPEKNFTENLQFALKAWKSADFTLASKYELVLDWLAQQGAQVATNAETLQTAELKELLQLKCQPGLISQQVKLQFVRMLLQWASDWQSPSSRLVPELMQLLAEYEIVQDLLRSNHELYGELFGQLLKSYSQYLLTLQDASFLPAQESEFFMQLLSMLRANAKKTSDNERFQAHYTTHVLQPLVEVSLIFQQHGMRFFEEILALEKQLYQEFDPEILLQRIMQQPLHVCLVVLECAIVNQRGLDSFTQLLIDSLFKGLLATQSELDPALMLTIAAYTLEMFRKHDIALRFIMNENTALTFLSKHICNYVKQFYQQHLEQVLQLLCATLKLNPLMLEKHIYELTTWMITAEKNTLREQQLFEDYMMLLMEMFRKLSRSEKLVVNLLKSLNEYLKMFKLGSVGETKVKRKHEEDANSSHKRRKLEAGVCAAAENVEALYLQIIFKDLNAVSTLKHPVDQLQSFPQLQNGWPWASVGVAFSKLIEGLVTKPSLVIWKTLIFSLKGVLEKIDHEEEITENISFESDLIAALFCQYFAGSKLAEQSDKFWSEIAKQYKLTSDMLNEFGRLLLSRSHNKRLMNAFLECSYYAAQFQLLVWYYRSDRLADATPYLEQAKSIHGFLTEEEWALLQQRVINFGKSSCKFNFNRLLLQRSQARLLLVNKKPTLSLQKILLAPLDSDLEQLQCLLQAPSASWLLHNLKRAEKLEIVRLINSVPNFDYSRLQVCSEDLEFFELLCLGLYEQLSCSFAVKAKKSLLASVSGEFDDLKIDADAAQDRRVTLVADAINAKIAPYTLKKLPKEEVQQLLKALKQLPIGCCRRQIKSVLFALHLALYRDLKAAQLEELAAFAFDIFTDMLHFGQQIQIFKYFSAQNMLQLLPVANAWEFYEFLYASMKNEEKSAERFLSALMEILQTTQTDAKLDDDHLKLILITIETLSVLTGPSAKRLRKHLEAALSLYAKHLYTFFEQLEGRSAKKDKLFVEKTLPGFATYMSSVLSKKDDEKLDNVLDENFRRICKIYIGYSMNYNNKHAIKLITVALNNRQTLHFDMDEIEFVLSGYWRQLNTDLKLQQLNAQNAEAVIKLIVANKTNEDFLLMLKDIGSQVLPEEMVHVTQLLTMFAKCPFSTIKGAIFNEQFKEITFSIILCLQKNTQFQYEDTQQLLKLLACQQAIVVNKMVPISYDTLDDILAFLIDINIKKFVISDTNVKLFSALQLAMTELCTALLKQRHVLLMDRVPQFMHIFKDLLQSIVWYKSERQKDTALSNEELDLLVELAQKLEALMHIVATHSLEVKRVAPFVLTYAINMMVANKRPTTLYPKIKTHIENVCYDLIGICDHRVGRFILRCSNEAARQVYELLVKDHKKYHKFKGKV